MPEDIVSSLLWHAESDNYQRYARRLSSINVWITWPFRPMRLPGLASAVHGSLGAPPSALSAVTCQMPERAGFTAQEGTLSAILYDTRPRMYQRG